MSCVSFSNVWLRKPLIPLQCSIFQHPSRFLSYQKSTTKYSSALSNYSSALSKHTPNYFKSESNTNHSTLPQSEPTQNTSSTKNKFISFADRNEIPIIIKTNNAPIHLFTKEVEEKAMKQVYALANSDIPVGHISIMPDVHWGKGSVVGAVFACKDKICPMAVGVDIGCGMTAIKVKDLLKYQLSPNSSANRTNKLLLNIQQGIKDRVPVGFNSHSRKPLNSNKVMSDICQQNTPSNWLHSKLRNEPIIELQLGTLGGGNHFLEVLYEDDKDIEDGMQPIWLMLHSGSRRVGNHTASYHENVGKEKYSMKGVKSPLYWLPIHSKDGRNYLQDMNWCQKYAFHSREYMLKSMIDVMFEVTGHESDWNSFINIHHNHCRCETCKYYDNKTGVLKEEELWITRKGATSAALNEIGIIPGSMATGSYIVKGLGNELSWKSCSHGAGRRMGRKDAMLNVTQSEFIHALDKAQVVCDRDSRLRDESPQAYKNLDEVISNQVQSRIIEVQHRLLPLVNVKGY